MPTNNDAASSPAPRRKPSRMIDGAGPARDGEVEREALYERVTITMPARARLDHTRSGQASIAQPIRAAWASIQK